MDLLPELLAREAALLVILFALGSGIAARLPRTVGSRLALAPAFGVAIGTALLAAVSWFTPLGHALWYAVLPACAISVAAAVLHLRRNPDPQVRAHLRSSLLAVVVVAGVALATFTAPLARRDSFGVIGYGIFDAPSYVSYTDGYARYKNDNPTFERAPASFLATKYDDDAWSRPWNLGARYAWIGRWQHTSSNTIPASLTGALGWDPWTMLSPFMVVLVATGALGIMALTSSLSERRRWPGVIAGLLYAGPVIFQIYMDGSQGMIAALSLLPAILTLGIACLRRPSWLTTISLGLLVAGLQASYPELIPITGGTIALVTGGLAVHSFVRHRSLPRLAVGARHLAVAAAVGLLASPRTTYWTVDYLIRQLSSLQAAQFLVPYQMRIQYLPGWLAQTREFYSFAFSRPGGGEQLFWGIVVPLALVRVMVAGLRRFPAAWPLLVLSVVAAAQAWTSTRTFSCGYCAQRSLLSLAAVVPVLIALGLVALVVRSKVAGAVVAAVLVAVLGVGVVGTMTQLQRRADRAFMVPPDVPRILDDVDDLPGTAPIALEGFDDVPLWSWAELQTTYVAIDERSGRRLAMAADHNDWGGLSYWRTRPRGHPAYTPGYEWVVTRFGGVESGRETLARSGPIALQRRTWPFDVTVARGAVADNTRRDRTGRAWVQAQGAQFGLETGPLTFWVAAASPEQALVRVELEGGPADLRVDSPGGDVAQARDGRGNLIACVPVPGDGDVRVATASISPAPPPLSAPTDPLDPAPVPSKAVRLVAVHVASTCTP